MAASASSLNVQYSGGGTYTGGVALGPCLTLGMGEEALVANLNAWGSTRDQEVLDLRAGLGVTQAGVAAAFEQARDALLTIVASFRGEAETGSRASSRQRSQ